MRVFSDPAKLKSLTILQGGMWYNTIPDAEYMQWWFERQKKMNCHM